MPWQKGQSGNPGGGKRQELADGRTLRELAREHTPAAIKALVGALADPTGAVRVSAATAILDRGWGKPAQAVELTGADGGPIETLDVGRAPVDVLRWLASQQVGDGDSIQAH